MPLTLTRSERHPLAPDGSRLSGALTEVVLVGAAYVLATQLFIRFVNFTAAMPAALAPPERSAGGIFLSGVLVQLGFVLALALMRDDMRRAVRGSLQNGNAAAWSVALVAVAIHASSVVLFFMDDSISIIEPSKRNAVLSLVPALDGWSQEVMFRGYVIYRLARSGAPAGLQIAASALLFSAIHFGYAGADLWSAWWPMFGTAVLGGFLAWSVRLGRGALLPAIICHALLIVIVQPWLALAN